MWGMALYERVCRREYQTPPGGGLALNLGEPIIQVDDGDHIRLRFEHLSYDLRCAQREPSGWRDNYFYQRGDLPPGPGGIPWQEVYTVIHTGGVTRAADGALVKVSSVEVAADWDSWCWTFSAQVLDDASLELIKPTEDGPVEVDIEIDGHRWLMLVESWQTGQVFGKMTRSIRGRSLSALLAEPYADPVTAIEGLERTALQLANASLEYTGWEVVFAGGFSDWLVPGGTASWDNKTPLAIILDVAAAVNGVVRTDPVKPEITIGPRYPVKPWQTAQATPDLTVPKSYSISLDGEWDKRPEYNSVTVAGETNGISATVTRAGTAGDKPAPMATHQLITATEAAASLGLAILGASGRWIKYTMALPVAPAQGDNPGILSVGSVVEYQVSPTVSWRGFVTGVSVRLERTDGGLKARQNVSVERFYGF